MASSSLTQSGGKMPPEHVLMPPPLPASLQPHPMSGRPRVTPRESTDPNVLLGLGVSLANGNSGINEWRAKLPQAQPPPGLGIPATPPRPIPPAMKNSIAAHFAKKPTGAPPTTTVGPQVPLAPAVVTPPVPQALVSVAPAVPMALAPPKGGTRMDLPKVGVAVPSAAPVTTTPPSTPKKPKKRIVLAASSSSSSSVESSSDEESDEEDSEDDDEEDEEAGEEPSEEDANDMDWEAAESSSSSVSSDEDGAAAAAGEPLEEGEIPAQEDAEEHEEPAASSSSTETSRLGRVIERLRGNLGVRHRQALPAVRAVALPHALPFPTPTPAPVVVRTKSSSSSSTSTTVPLTPAAEEDAMPGIEPTATPLVPVAVAMAPAPVIHYDTLPERFTLTGQPVPPEAATEAQCVSLVSAALTLASHWPAVMTSGNVIPLAQQGAAANEEHRQGYTLALMQRCRNQPELRQAAQLLFTLVQPAAEREALYCGSSLGED